MVASGINKEHLTCLIKLCCALQALGEEEEDEDYGDITQPDPSEFLGQQEDLQAGTSKAGTLEAQQSKPSSQKKASSGDSSREPVRFSHLFLP